MELVVQLLLNSICRGAVYALLALGFALIYNTYGVLHVAHAAVFSIMALLFYVVFETLGLNLFLSMVVIIILGAFIGAIMKVAFYGPLERRGLKQGGLLLASLGLFFFLQGLTLVGFGAQGRAVTPLPGLALNVGGITISRVHILILAISVVALVALQVTIMRTKVGKAIRALTSNRELAIIVGIDVERLLVYTFAIGSAIGGLAIALLCLDIGVRIELSLNLLLYATVATLIGSVGYLPGAVVGGLLIGVLETLAAYLIPGQWTVFVTFAVIFVLLICRPHGIFGQRTLGKEE